MGRKFIKVGVSYSLAGKPEEISALFRKMFDFDGF